MSVQFSVKIYTSDYMDTFVGYENDDDAVGEDEDENDDVKNTHTLVSCTISQLN